ncbi:endonuclease domain-containing protein [Sphingomonas sp. HF-S3]|uniref:Endonuclease domain-containing protein n=1 Tax=Sphingomonas rustica TaxID=3103142 RepID=A0ABV0BAW1_9SPHN
MFKDRSPKGNRNSIRRSRAQRREMSLPEVLLWQALRTRPEHLKFPRQHPSGEYSLDFYCGDAALAIEVDGEAHSRGDRPARDERRDAWLAERGIETLRVPASVVLRDPVAAADAVVAVAVARLPLHHPAARGGPPPRDELGEDRGR